MAGTLDPSARNQTFQPGRAKSVAVWHPSQARYSGATVKQLTPILLPAPSRIEVGLKKPADAVVRPMVTRAGGK